ncbi:MAG: alpha/beta hydrolase, partial [Ignavibacteriaceae bacterium]|nr:alpha/beta hydrolase [Ignavibacteriaceae bacterium]
FRRFRSRYSLAERDIIVWLPPSYKKNTDKNYPVLYMHDGQNLMDPYTSFAGQDWRVDETVTRLIKANLINEIIVVGIYNTHDRLEEYSNGERGNNYRKFITEELKHFIDSNFRTMQGRENTAIMGSSMGGLCSFYTAWDYPGVFSMAGCLSSSFYFNEDNIFKMIESYKGEKKNIRLYIDSGEDGKKDAQKMYCLLTSKGLVLGDDMDYYYDRGAGHNEAAWANRLARPLIYFFGKHH